MSHHDQLPPEVQQAVSEIERTGITGPEQAKIMAYYYARYTTYEEIPKTEEERAIAQLVSPFIEAFIRDMMGAPMNFDPAIRDAIFQGFARNARDRGFNPDSLTD